MLLGRFIISRLMPLWILFFSFVAFHWSGVFSAWGNIADLALGFVLFVMGMTLDLQRLKQFIRRPLQPILGSLGHWVIAPLVSVALAWCFFGLHSELAGGIVMAGVVPSGTSSNLNALIAGGDLSLSVAMSALDTIVGPILTPALSEWFAGSGVHMAYLPFVLKTARIVFFPLMLGILLQRFLPRFADSVRGAAPILSALALYVVVLGIVAPASHTVLAHASVLPLVLLCAVLQIVLQMIFGTLYARMIGFDDASTRSQLFEVGICNTALAAVLATEAFGPLAGVAAMMNMVCNLTIGSLVAVLLSRRVVREMEASH